LGDLLPRKAFLPQIPNLIPAKNGAGPADCLTAAGPGGAGSLQPGADPFPETDALLFGQTGQQTDNHVPEGPGAVDPCLGEAPPPNSIGFQCPKILEGREGAFSGEPVECPENQHIELALGCKLAHPIEFGPVCLAAAVMVFEFGDYGPALRIAELPELASLIIDILTLVPR